MSEDYAELWPRDEFNAELEGYVHPSDWVNPTPDGRYNLVVIGGGTAGLVSAAVAVGLGAKVALVERRWMGGDCLNTGCVPSKAMIRSARALADGRRAAEFGIEGGGDIRADFASVMERMRRLRSEIGAHDSVKRFSELGVDVFLGHGVFVGPDAIEVDGARLGFQRAVIATGSRPAVPSIFGLEEIGYLTNETVFSLTELPRRLAVVGAGPIGCELAQTFARLGTEVDLIETMHGVMPREDREAAAYVEAAMKADGVRLLCCGRDLQAAKGGEGRTRLRLESHGEKCESEVDRLLVSVGRSPNIDGMGLDKAGVHCSDKGVVVDDYLRTSNRRIYAAGDVCSPFQFTHAADFMARRAVQNALFMGRAKVSRMVIPWCTYTSPEVARVGMVEAEAQARGVPIETYTQRLSDVDRAVLDGESEGFVKVHVRKKSDRIVGATIVASNAGDLIANLSLAMTHGLGLKQLSGTIFPYPTQAEAVRKVGDAFNRSRLTPFVKGLLTRWLRWRR